jgi:hypothetical protein
MRKAQFLTFHKPEPPDNLCFPFSDLSSLAVTPSVFSSFVSDPNSTENGWGPSQAEALSFCPKQSESAPADAFFFIDEKIQKFDLLVVYGRENYSPPSRGCGKKCRNWDGAGYLLVKFYIKNRVLPFVLVLAYFSLLIVSIAIPIKIGRSQIQGGYMISSPPHLDSMAPLYFGQSVSGGLKGEVAAALIGPEGGILRVTDPGSPLFGTTLRIPPGALEVPAWIQIELGEHPCAFGLGPSVKITPEGLSFKRPVEIDMRITGQSTLLEDQLPSFYVFDGANDQWVARDGFAIDSEGGVFRCSVWQL